MRLELHVIFIDVLITLQFVILFILMLVVSATPNNPPIPISRYELVLFEYVILILQFVIL